MTEQDTAPHERPAMQNITTDTHDIRATYTVGDTNEWHEIDVNGYTYAEIVDDMLDFWNEADNRDTEFIVERTFREDDYAITQIVGTVYDHRDGVVDESIVDVVTVQVTAVER